MKLIDTSVAIDHLRGVDDATLLLSDAIRAGEEIAASELTRFELLTGVRASERPRVEQFFGALLWVPVTEDIARQAGDYARKYRRSRSGIGAADYLIAATAAVLGAELLTLNVRYFPMFTALAAPYGSA